MPTWRTDWKGVESYISAETRSKARYRVYLSAADVFPDVKIHEIKVWRAKELDHRNILRPTGKDYLDATAEHFPTAPTVEGKESKP